MDQSNDTDDITADDNDKSNGMLNRRAVLGAIASAGILGSTAVSGDDPATSPDQAALGGGPMSSQVANQQVEILEGPESERPSAGVERRVYHATDTNTVFRDDGSSWSKIDIGVGSLRTDSINSVADVIVGPNDDAQTKIENANSNAVIFLSPNTTYDAADITFSIAQTIWGWNTVLQKSADGNIATDPGKLNVYGVIFDGNKGNHTGDGVVDAANDQNPSVYRRCEFIDCSGAARVEDGARLYRYERCKFNNSDAGVKFTSSNIVGRRQRFVSCEVQNNRVGFLFQENTFDAQIGVRFQLNTEANVKVDGARPSNLAFTGTLSACDGPAITVVNSGQLADWSFGPGMKMKDNNRSDPSGLTTPVGTIHIESDTAKHSLYFYGGVYEAPNGDQIWISNQGSSKVRCEVFGATPGAGGVDFDDSGTNVELLVVGRNWDGQPLTNATSGIYMSSDSFPGEYIQGLASESKIYLRQNNSTPHSASGTGDMYVDFGNNPPTWEIDDPTDNSWETMG